MGFFDEITGQQARVTLVSNQQDGIVSYGTVILTDTGSIPAALQDAGGEQVPLRVHGPMQRHDGDGGHLSFSDRMVSLTAPQPDGPTGPTFVDAQPFAVNATETFGLTVSVGALGEISATLRVTGWSPIEITALTEIGDAVVGIGAAIGKQWATAKATYTLTCQHRTIPT